MYVIPNIKPNKDLEVLKDGFVFSCKAKDLVLRLRQEVLKREKALQIESLKGLN